MTGLDLDPDRELAELRAYLGDAYDERRLERYWTEVEEELARSGDEQRFYRTSEAYLYDLTVFAMSQTKRPYLEALTALAAPPARILDVGCGIGSDGLALLGAGYDVTFADFDNPSTRYLRWRLERRGLAATIVDLDAGPLPHGFDVAYAFDVLEHVDDPAALLDRMERSAATVVVNLLEPAPDDPPHHRELAIGPILRRAATHRVRAYAVHHGRSHLVAYDSAPAGALTRLRSRARVRA
jgi:SAM-dependent methyltransferase